MTLILRLSVIVICVGAEIGGFGSLNFDFLVVNYDVMNNLIYKSDEKPCAKPLLKKEKERKYRINTCVPIWCR